MQKREDLIAQPVPVAVKNGVAVGGPAPGVWSALHAPISVSNPHPTLPLMALWITSAYFNAAIGGLVQVEVEVSINGAGPTGQYVFNPPGNVNSGIANEYIISSMQFPQVSFLTIPPGGTVTIEGRMRWTEIVTSGVQTCYVMSLDNTIYAARS
jgi:hypothetical protein